MQRPIVDFITEYSKNPQLIRAHMPGHKGAFGTIDERDITEIPGADSLYEADGIIALSEANASALFGAHTFYSTEGSSLSIRAMLYLAMTNSKQIRKGHRPVVLAGRNAHKVFLSAAALLDYDIAWLYPSPEESYLSCGVTPAQVEEALVKCQENLPFAVYLTSPDYLGNQVDIQGIAEVCHRYGIYLLVDNAHGAYLRFLPESKHPIDQGADLCCDSAHKTLPALTGAGYLHLGKHLPKEMVAQAKSAMALFGSTSPSYLILESLDRINPYLAEDYKEDLNTFLSQMKGLKDKLQDNGYILLGEEPLKITIHAKSYGYTGSDMAEYLRIRNIICEFADPDYLVLMLTPQNGEEAIRSIGDCLLSLPKRDKQMEEAPKFAAQEVVLSVREATFSPGEWVAVDEAEGRILHSPSVGCPPAVPIVVCGELIDKHAIDCFRYYGITSCYVVKE